MARGKKRSRSLLELMDPQKDYRPSIEPVLKDSDAGVQAQGQENGPAEPVVKPVSKPVVKAAVKSAVVEAPAERGEEEGSIEPILAIREGKVKLVLNYPLAIMVCFVVAVILLCAVLVGWKLGRDEVVKSDLQPRVENRLPVIGPKSPFGSGSR